MAPKLLPGFTILMPTFNSEKRIRRCLDSIRRQDYPADNVQILVADGGSTDGTVDIARSFGATVVDNPLRLAEEGLRVGMPHVAREFVVIFADDNEFAQDNWLSAVAAIFDSDPRICAFFCRLGASADDPAVNKYYGLVESEPLNFYMNRNLHDYLAHSGVRERGGVEYKVFDVDPERPLVWGANGLTYRTEFILKIWQTEEYLGDNDAFQIMVESGHHTVAYTRDLCVFHHHVSGLWSWRKKWGRNFQQHFLKNLDSRNLNWLYIPHFNAKLIAWVLYSLIPIVSVPVAVARAIRERDWHWLYHPAAAFLQAATYVRIMLLTPEGRDYLRNWMCGRGVRAAEAPGAGPGTTDGNSGA
ncbi:MAG: glycosyltransferase family 2 protein [Candidatus Geothermincolia bacterium]